MTKTNIIDKRTGDDCIGFVLFNDTFLSGWGDAEGGTSLYALAVKSNEEADIVTENGNARTDMVKPRFVHSITDLRGKAIGNNHLVIVGRGEAERWHQPGAFAL